MCDLILVSALHFLDLLISDYIPLGLFGLSLESSGISIRSVTLFINHILMIVVMIVIIVVVDLADGDTNHQVVIVESATII